MAYYERSDARFNIPTMLNDDIKRKLAERLATRRGQLQTEIRDKLAAAREVMGSGAIDQVIELGDSALANFIADLDLAEVKRDVAELREIEAAQERFAAGTYGVCIDCDADIAEARLQVYPTALRCLRCQSHYEVLHGASQTPKL